MIYNQNANGLRALHVDMPDVLEALLLDRRFQFYLTGSRAFRQADALSDWDFFTKDNPLVAEFLTNLGFEEEYENPYHGDVNAVRVFKLDSSPSVHVQFVARLDIKYRTQEYIRKHFGEQFFYTLTKQQRKQVWQMVQIILKEQDGK